MKTKRILFPVIYFLLTVIPSLKAQQNTFSKVFYDSTAATYGYGVVQSFDNGYVIAGSTGSEGLILKIDSAGNYLWSKKIGSSGYEVFNCIIATTDSCFVLAGKTFNTSSGHTEILCVKVNSNGDTLWSKAIAFSGSQEALSIQQTIDSGYIITGYVGISGPPNFKIFVAKINFSGFLEWAHVFTCGNNANSAFSVKQTPDSGYVIIGFIENFPPIDANAFLIKLSPAGTVSWSKKYNLPIPTVCGGNDLEVVPNGLLCYLNSGNDMVLMKTDFLGNILWSKNYSNIGSSICLNCPSPKIHKTSDNGYVFLSGIGSCVKIDSVGNVLWTQSPYLYPIDIIELKDKGYFIIGNGPIFGVKSSSTSNPQMGIIKTDSTGNALVCISPGQTVTPIADTLITTSAVFTNTSGGVLNQIYPDVNIPTLLSDSGCVAIIGGIKENNPDNNVIVFPNPSSGKITIESNTPGGYFELHDISGKLLMKDVLTASKFEMDISRLNSGLYYLTLYQKDKQIHRKILKD
ncbi:MAG: T9SS type A sorting domain-containing protein [Bacteroidetes bacterium]|nr:T9SS type A sorting domain-containing protein [Bacteroidota bacterium]